jgi:hypothetical protein
MNIPKEEGLILGANRIFSAITLTYKKDLLIKSP